ncbi:MAG: D-tyrosyl-tRNA(Tyr) deacylase [Candidatus Omnitrophica bacterium]|nr:D-tyrosyl-tRNA(Tyr) deacylase [Candidatus Omnitrophota bacterium]
MRILIQRVKNSKVCVGGKATASIQKGFLALVGVGKEDKPEDIERLAEKVMNLRIFEDEQGKMNLNIKQVKGQVLSVPQFTLYADTRKGNRPGFDLSAAPDMAKDYWERFNNLLVEGGVNVQKGVFAAHMEVELVNDGPVTIWLDSK